MLNEINLSSVVTPALERLREKKAELEKKKSYLIYKKHDLIGSANVQKKIDEVTQKIEEMEEYAPKRLSELVPKEVLQKRHLAEKIIMTHLAADFLCHTAFVLRDDLRQLGLTGCSLLPMVSDITKKASEYASIVYSDSFHGLGDLFMDNGKLIDDLTTLCHCYLQQHLNLS